MSTLGEEFLLECLPHVVSKRLFGGYQMPLGGMVYAGLWVFQKGALLGRARRSSFQALASLIAEPGRGESLAQVMRQSAEDRMRRSSSSQVTTFWEFWQLTEYPDIAFGDLEVLKVLGRKKIRLGEVLPKTDLWAADGIGFGAMFPDVTESLWRRSYEISDPEKWKRARQIGVELPEQQDLLPLEEIEPQVLAEVRAFAQQNRPNHLSLLTL